MYRFSKMSTLIWPTARYSTCPRSVWTWDSPASPAGGSVAGGGASPAPIVSWLASALLAIPTEPLGLTRRHDDAAAVTLADAVGGDALMIGQGHVDDATLGRGHRVEEDGLAVTLGALGGTHGDVTQQPGSSLPISFGIKDDADSALGAAADEQAGQELECLEGLAAPADQDAAVLA